MLATAMEEARQSPFHAMAATLEPSLLDPPTPRLSHSGNPQVPDPTTGPSFHSVFWPTLGATVVSYPIAFLGMACLTIDMKDGTCPGDTPILNVARAATLLLLPATAAKLKGASFKKALLGSLTGFAGGAGLGAMGMVVLTPVVHATATTVFGRR